MTLELQLQKLVENEQYDEAAEVQEVVCYVDVSVWWWGAFVCVCVPCVCGVPCVICVCVCGGVCVCVFMSVCV
jgi:hypothetical protein